MRYTSLCDGFKVLAFVQQVEASVARLAEEQRQRYPHQQLVVFPPIQVELAERVALKWQHLSTHVTRALTSGAEVGIYRPGLDISFPPGAMHLQRPEYASDLRDAAAAASACAPTRHYLAFDGTTIRARNLQDPIGAEYVSRYRARLAALHAPGQGIHVVVCPKRAARAAAAGAAKAKAVGMSSQQPSASATTTPGREPSTPRASSSCAGPSGGKRGLRDSLNASFVLVPRGDMPYAYRLLEALAFGAIPVVLSDEYVLPFSEVVEWEAFSVHWPYSRVSSLVPYLRTLSDERVCAMRRQARRAWEAHFQSPEAHVDTLLHIMSRRQRS